MQKRADYDRVADAEDQLQHPVGHSMGHMFREGAKGAIIGAPLGLIGGFKPHKVMISSALGGAAGAFNGYLKSKQERNLDAMILSENQKAAYYAGRDYAIKLASASVEGPGIILGTLRGLGQAAQGVFQGTGKVIHGVGTVGHGIDNEFARMNPDSIGGVMAGAGMVGLGAYGANEYNKSKSTFPGSGYQPAPF